MLFILDSKFGIFLVILIFFFSVSLENLINKLLPLFKSLLLLHPYFLQSLENILRKDKLWIRSKNCPPFRSLHKIVNENPHVFPFHPDDEMALWWSVLDALDGGGDREGSKESLMVLKRVDECGVKLMR